MGILCIKVDARNNLKDAGLATIIFIISSIGCSAMGLQEEKEESKLRPYSKIAYELSLIIFRIALGVQFEPQSLRHMNDYQPELANLPSLPEGCRDLCIKDGTVLAFLK